MSLEIKDIQDALNPMVAGVKSEISNEIKAIEAKHAADVAQMNEDAKKKGETLEELKGKIDAMAAKANALKSNLEAKSYSSRSAVLEAEVKEMIAENFDKIKSETPFSSTKLGTMTLGGELTGTSQISYVPNNQMRSILSNPRLYELFRVIPTATGNVTFPRGNSPVGEGSFGAQTEGNAKAQVDYDVTMVNVSVPFIAGYVKVSRQMLQDLPFLQAYLSQSLVEDFNQAVNTRFLNTIASGSTALSSSETYTSAKMVDGITQHAALGLGAANLILTTHKAWGDVLKTKPSDYSVPGGTVIAPDGSVRIAGISVIPHVQVTTGRFYVLNTDAFAIAQASGFTVRSTETDQDDFIKNIVTYRGEARIELLSFQPKAAVYGTIGS
jgi:HK97 family phage major capsid protein